MLKKVMLNVDKYFSPDGEVDVTKARLKRWESNVKKLKSAGRVIPVSWGHPDSVDDSLSMTNAEYLKALKKPAKERDTVGHLADFKLTRDGRAAELTFDIKDEDAFRKAKNNVLFASPIIMEEFEADGEKYEDAITHVDLVNHPVDKNQGPFKAEPAGSIACGLRMGLSSTPFYTRADMKRFRFGDDGPPAKKKDDDGGEEKGGGGGDKKGGEGGRLKSILEQLEKMGIVLPEDTDESNFLEKLEPALLTKAAGDGIGDDDMGGDDMGGGSPGSPPADTLGGPAMAGMSLIKRLGLKAVSDARKRLSLEIDELENTGRCYPHEAKTQREALKTVKMSLDPSGEVGGTAVSTWVEARKTVPEGTMWDPAMRTRMSRAVKQPDEVHGDDITEERADEIAEEVITGRKPAKKAE